MTCFPRGWLGRWRFFGIVIGVVLGLVIASCTSDVTEKYRADLQRDWCVTADVFVCVDPIDSHVGVDRAGSHAGVPESADEYLADPEGWSANEKHKKYLSNPNAYVPRILAAFRKGSRFRIVRVEEFSSYDHATVTPMVVFRDDKAGLEPARAALLFDQSPQVLRQRRLVGEWAEACGTPTVSGPR